MTMEERLNALEKDVEYMMTRLLDLTVSLTKAVEMMTSPMIKER